MFENLILHALIIYFFARNTRLDESKLIRAIGLLSIIFCYALIELLNYLNLSTWYYILAILTVEVLIFIVYLIFYNNDVFIHQMKWYLPLQITFVTAIYLNYMSLTLLLAIIGLWLTFYNYSKIDRYMIGILLVITIFSFMINTIALLPIIIAIDLIQLLVRSENDKKLNNLQKKYLSHQYEEIKNVYINMRGWRHDYHNHIQAMKAYSSMGQYNELEDYLGKLEYELESVDQLVQSGHIMMDAILNSKITIMMKHNIQVDFKALLPESIKIKDVDLCIIVSNLLENAIESCNELDTENRFIRVFSEVHKSQFYLSVQNSANEELSFDQKHYISSKRGNHGLGIKRVQFLTDKYDGYLNLQNEAGIFASEVTIPV